MPALNTFEDGVAMMALERAEASKSRVEVSESASRLSVSRDDKRAFCGEDAQFNTATFASTLRSRRARQKGAAPALRWQSRFTSDHAHNLRLLGASVDMNALGLSVPRHVARKVRGKRAESTAQKIDRDLLSLACLQAVQWGEERRLLVSMTDVEAPDAAFNARLGEVLEETGFDAALLDLIFSEAGLQHYDAEVCFTLAALRDRGVGVYVSGFGEGPSSLTLLKERASGGLLDGVQFDCSVLLSAGNVCKKLDETSVLDPVSVAFYRASLLAVRSLGLRIRVCGVELQEQLSFARDVGADEISGGLLAAPETMMQSLMPRSRKGRYRVKRSVEPV
ncbi:EAL domain-containing protein [Neokomagataea anthophila]|uniref:EAL domain-containing protein n=1 Tax=Neokomagataea anthophila TaxID=2826925 RepID=A0ABS5E649_9PROT|nr:EAL domain-containing protein [Neokomagataea anthophila]MBR0559382.1 EAL domain-containing protein [Neokomagataea anthophila]